MDMEVTIREFQYSFSRDMEGLDELVLNFIKVLNNMDVKYVVVYGIGYNTFWKNQDF